MEESRIIKMINNNPSIISTINNPTDEMKLLAIKKDGLTLEYIENPTIEMQQLALDNNIRAITIHKIPASPNIVIVFIILSNTLLCIESIAYNIDKSIFSPFVLL